MFDCRSLIRPIIASMPNAKQLLVLLFPELDRIAIVVDYFVDNTNVF